MSEQGNDAQEYDLTAGPLESADSPTLDPSAFALGSGGPAKPPAVSLLTPKPSTAPLKRNASAIAAAAMNVKLFDALVATAKPRPKANLATPPATADAVPDVLAEKPAEPRVDAPCHIVEADAVGATLVSSDEPQSTTETEDAPSPTVSPDEPAAEPLEDAVEAAADEEPEAELAPEADDTSVAPTEDAVEVVAASSPDADETEDTVVAAAAGVTDLRAADKNEAVVEPAAETNAAPVDAIVRPLDTIAATEVVSFTPEPIAAFAPAFSAAGSVFAVSGVPVADDRVIDVAPLAEPVSEPAVSDAVEDPVAMIDVAAEEADEQARRRLAGAAKAFAVPVDAEDDASIEDAPQPEEPADDAAPAGPTGAWWTLPTLFAGIAVVACAVLVPAADENRRASHELAKIEQEVSYFREQSDVNKQFLDHVATDPTLAERLAMRQLRLARPDARPVDFSQPQSGFVMSPYALVHVDRPAPLPAYEPVGGVLGRWFNDTRRQIYFAGAGLLLVAAGVILGGRATPSEPN